MLIVVDAVIANTDNTIGIIQIRFCFSFLYFIDIIVERSDPLDVDPIEILPTELVSVNKIISLKA